MLPALRLHPHFGRRKPGAGPAAGAVLALRACSFLHCGSAPWLFRCRNRQMNRQMNRRMNRQMRHQRRRTIGPENAGWPGGLAPAMPSAAEYSLLPEASNGGWQADWQGIWHGAGDPRLPAAVDACATSKAPCGRMPGRNSDGSPIQRVPRPLRHPGRLEPFCRDDRRRAPPPCGLDAALRSCQ